MNNVNILFVIFFILVGFVGSIFVIPTAFGLCQSNPDWPERPCYGFPGAVSISPEQRWNEWSAYYDYKGEEWMEIKQIELLQAFANDSVEKWMNEDETFANDNVFHYYYYKGETPNLDGTFVYHTSISDKEIDFPCGPDAIFVNGVCKVITTDYVEHWPVSSFTDGLFFIIFILPFFIPGAFSYSPIE